MDRLGSIRDLYQHMEWADAAMWRGVFTLPEPEAVPRLADVLHHFHLTQQAFLKVWTGQTFQFDRAVPPLGEIMAGSRAYHLQARQFVDDLQDETLGREVLVPWAARLGKRLGQEPAATTLDETLTQVVMHSAYHRGQANSRVKGAGGDPPNSDFIAWVWLSRPAPGWPAAGASE